MLPATDAAPAPPTGGQRPAVCDGTVHHVDSYTRAAYNVEMAEKTERLNLRLTPAQDTVVRTAAEQRGETISEYVIRHAVESAEADLADRRVFVLDDARFRQLEAVLDGPATYRPRLEKLLESPSVLEE